MADPGAPSAPLAPTGPVAPAAPPVPAVSIRPIVQRYFYVPTQEIDLAAPAVIPANQFVDDRGEPASRIADHGEQGFFDLYVNGVMQEGSLYDVAPERVVLQAAGGTISAGTPVIVQSVGFSISAKPD